MFPMQGMRVLSLVRELSKIPYDAMLKNHEKKKKIWELLIASAGQVQRSCGEMSPAHSKAAKGGNRPREAPEKVSVRTRSRVTNPGDV